MEILERHCTGCDTTKVITEFVKDKTEKTGYTYRCKECRRKTSYAWATANPEKVKAANLKNRDKRKAFYTSTEGVACSRRAHLKRVLGMTLEDFNTKLTAQGGVCELCGENNTRDKHGVMAVDHNHETGAIRGLLCFKCNSALGNFNDNKELLMKAINYLEKYESITIM